MRAALCLALLPTAAAAPHSFTVTSAPVRLRYGEVHNTIQLKSGNQGFPLPDDVVNRYRDRISADGPNDGRMAVIGWTLDIIRKMPDGSEQSVPLYDHYNHHYILHIGGAQGMIEFMQALRSGAATDDMQGRGLSALKRRAKPGDAVQWVDFGGASGAEFRNNPHAFAAPYRVVIDRPEVWAPELHIIHTQRPNASGAGEVSPLLQCPCSPQRKIDPAAGTIDGKQPYPTFGCSKAMREAGNPSCGLSTYRGGWRCCEDGVMLIDTRQCREPNCTEYPRDEVFVRFTFQYEDANPSTQPLHGPGCCDASSDVQGDGNIEFDVPQCPVGTPPSECVFVWETVQPMDYFNASRFWPLPNGSSIWEGDLEVDLVYAAPHLHVTGISLEMMDALTNQTICKASRDNGKVIYGAGSKPGDEQGYITGLLPCTWGNGTTGGTPPRFRRSHPIRTRAVYNATHYQTGVMALWLSQAAMVSPMS